MQAADLTGVKQLPRINCSLESVPRREKREEEPSQMQLISHAALNNCQDVIVRVKNSETVQPYTLLKSF